MNKLDLITQCILKDSRIEKEKGNMCGTLKYSVLKEMSKKELETIYDTIH